MRCRGSRSARCSRGTGSDVLSKIVVLFLVFIAVLGMFGKLRTPQLPRFGVAKCRDCGRHKIGKGPCPCQTGKG